MSFHTNVTVPSHETPNLLVARYHFPTREAAETYARSCDNHPTGVYKGEVEPCAGCPDIDPFDD